MRTAFIDALMAVAAEDPRVWLVTGDLGYSVLERFRDRFPDRFVNAGVAEQNMTGLAAGLALSGKIPFTYSIANFATLRCLEQIRNDVVYHRLPVKVVSVGAGLTYGAHGYSHHGIEDMAILRSLPGMTVVAPGDPVEARLATRALAAAPGPAYLRLGKAGEPVVHRVEPAFTLGRAIVLQEGPRDDGALLATGNALKEAVDAAGALAAEGVNARVLSFPTLKPLDEEAVRRAARETRLLVSVEEHSVTGGLGSAIADVLAALPGPRALLRKYGLPDGPSHLIGSQAFLRRQRAGDLVAIVREALSRESRGG